MQFGSEYSDYPDPDKPSAWGKGSPVKIGLVIRFDWIAFWRIVPHRHVKPDHDNRAWYSDTQVNARCDKCYLWFTLSTGKLHPNQKG